MKFSNEEYNVLNKIATKSKMDCWFSITQDENEEDYILDLENGSKLSIYEGVGQLVDGMTNYADYDLTKDEIETFENLIDELNIEFIQLNN
jgi:hypothetical protein